MWDTFVVNPMINALLVLYDLLFNNFFLAIAVFTLAIRFVTLPLNLRQQRTSMKMQEIQPEIQAIQKKYKDNPQKMQEEFAKIGYNPADSLMGCLPLLLQLPILFGLYSAIRLLLGSTPQSLFDLVQRVNPNLVDLQSLFPIDNQFLWMNLGQPDALFILPVAVFVTSYLQQKLMTPSRKKEDDDKKGKKKEENSNPMAGMTQSMQVTMPVMFGFMSLGFPAGLSLYFILANLIGIGQGLIIRRSMDKTREEHEAEKIRGKSGGEPAPSSADVAVAKSSNSSGKKTAAGASANGQKSATKSQSNKSQKSRRRKRR